MKMEVVIFDMHKSMFALSAFQCQFNILISAKLTFILFKVKFCMSLVIPFLSLYFKATNYYHFIRCVLGLYQLRNKSFMLQTNSYNFIRWVLGL